MRHATWFPMLLLCATSSLEASPFLTQSTAAKKAGLTFLISRAEKGKALVLPAGSHLESQPKHLLGDDGRLHPLQGSITKARGKLPWGCGRDADAAVLTVANGKQVDGMLVVVGSEATSQVKWHPARKVNEPERPRCLAFKYGYALQDFSLFTSAGLKDTVYVATWSAQVTASVERCSLAGGGESAGFVDAGGSCATLNAIELDCDGMLVKRQGPARSTRAFVGALEIGGERWLIFESRGYESGGYTAIRFEVDTPIDPSEIEEVRPWGC